MAHPLLPCPSCGFKTIVEPEYGSFCLCPVCNWEDCRVQLANPLDDGGPNLQSLVEYQRRSVSTWPLEVMRVGEYEREEAWRPLSDAEIAFYRRETDDGRRLVFGEIREPEQCYWSRNVNPG